MSKYAFGKKVNMGFELVQRPEVGRIAAEVRGRLERVMAAL
jgi:hypothetical protein